jgi:hypothetical protein
MPNEKDYSSMSKTELIDHAETLGLSIPVSWTKERIISKINQKIGKSKSSAASNSSEALTRIKFIEWLENNNLQKYEAIFSENDIELDIVPQIEDDDLREMGVSIGDRKRFLKAKTDLKIFEQKEAPVNVISLKKDQCIELIMDIMTWEGTMFFPIKEAENFVNDFFKMIEKSCNEIVVKMGPAIGDRWLALGLVDTCYTYFVSKQFNTQLNVENGQTCVLTDVIALKCGLIMAEGLGYSKDKVKVFENALVEFEKRQDTTDVFINELGEKFPQVKEYFTETRSGSSRHGMPMWASASKMHHHEVTKGDIMYAPFFAIIIAFLIVIVAVHYAG